MNRIATIEPEQTQRQSIVIEEGGPRVAGKPQIPLHELERVLTLRFRSPAPVPAPLPEERTAASPPLPAITVGPIAFPQEAAPLQPIHDLPTAGIPDRWQRLTPPWKMVG